MQKISTEITLLTHFMANWIAFPPTPAKQSITTPPPQRFA